MPEADVDDQIRTALRSRLAGPVEPGSPIGAIRRRVERRRVRRRALGVLAAVSVGVIGLAAVATSRDRGPAEEQVDLVAPSSSAPPASAREVLVMGTGPVTALPPAPLDVRGDSAVVWDGSQLVVWGGDVEAFNMGLAGSDRTFTDGAYFDAAQRRWFEMSPSPLPNTPVTPIGVSTDAGIVIVRGTAAAVWSPKDNTWRKLPDAPRQILDLTSSGAGAVSVTGGVRLDVDAGRWTAMAGVPRLERPAVTWTGTELFAVGHSLEGGGVAAAAYDPATNVWRALKAPPVTLETQALSVGWDGTRVVAVNYDMVAAAYSPVSDSWTLIDRVPARFSEWYPKVTVAGGRLVVFMAHAVVVLDDEDRWVPLPYGSIRSGQVASGGVGARGAGRLVIVWGFDGGSASNVATVLDLEQMVAPSRLQVGVADVGVPAEFSLSKATYKDDDVVEVVLAGPGGRRCTIRSEYGVLSLADGTSESLGDPPRPWVRDEAGERWQVMLAERDRVEVECAEAADARAIASSVNSLPAR